MAVLSVVVPAYNEEVGIGNIVNRVLAITDALAHIGMSLEFLVVDDGSHDRTAALVAEHSGVQLIRHPVNQGYGAAIKTGFRHASGDFVAFLDADGTYPPESLPDMCRTAIERQADLVVGSRMSGGQSEMPVLRRVGNYAYARLLSLIGNVTVRDTASGMRVIRREMLSRLYPLPDGLDFTPAMSTRAIYENLKIVEVPINYSERIGRSKLSVVRDGVRFTNAIVWTALAYNPVRVLGLLSLILLGLASAIGVYIVALRLNGVTTLDRPLVFALFGAAVFSVMAVSLFALGAMFNYLVALFLKRPVKQGLFGKPLMDPPLDHHFGWMGIVAILGGLVLGIGAFLVSLGGWETSRLWLYLLISALLIIIGLQLSVSWLVMRVLEELAQREVSAQRDLVEAGTGTASPPGSLGQPAEMGASLQLSTAPARLT